MRLESSSVSNFHVQRTQPRCLGISLLQEAFILAGFARSSLDLVGQLTPDQRATDGCVSSQWRSWGPFQVLLVVRCLGDTTWVLFVREGYDVKFKQ